MCCRLTLLLILSIVNVAILCNGKISNNKTLDICNRRDNIPLKLSSSDMGLYNNKSNITAINDRDPKSNCDREKAVDMESSDFNVGTSEIPCSKVPVVKFARSVSDVESGQVLFPGADDSKAISKKL